MVLDTSLFNTQQYKVRIKGKVEQSRETSSALPYTLKREPSGRPRLWLPTYLLIIIIIITDDLSLESEWQQISSVLQDSS